VSFNTPGVYTYICKDHPWSYGNIIVMDKKAHLFEKVRQRSDDSAGDRSPSTLGEPDRGRVLFSKQCAACHGEDLGGRAAAPGLSGDMFGQQWRDKPVTELLKRIQSTMPQRNPGSLPRQAYLDIISYLLRANDLMNESGIVRGQ